MRLNIGSQMCITKDRLFKVFTPGLHPRQFAESDVFDAEPSRVDFYMIFGKLMVLKLLINDFNLHGLKKYSFIVSL